MANANFEAWLAALESGEYEQSTGQLCEISASGRRKYCCLGVACELAVAAGVVRSAVKHDDTVAFGSDPEKDANYATPEESSSGYLPPQVAAWLGLDEVDPHTQYLHRRATQMNDGYKWTFAQIARAFRGEDVEDDTPPI